MEDFLSWVTSAARQVGDVMLGYGPSVLAAVALAAGGWVLGRLLARWTVHLVDRFAPGLEEQGTRLAVAPLGGQRRLAEVIGKVVFWLVMVMFLAAAAESLGLAVVATWLARAGELLPRLLLGGLVVLAGVLAGALAREAVTTAAAAGGLSQATWLGRAAQIALVTAAVVTGMEQVGLDSQFVTAMLAVTLGGVLGGTALAFALGARFEVGNMVAMHYVRQSFKVGQTLRIGGAQGRIREFTKTAVLLEGATGHSRVPGRVFSQEIAEAVTADE